MKSLFAILCLPAFLAGTAGAQVPLPPRATSAKPAKTKLEPAKHDAERISVKFRDDLPVRLRNGKLSAVDAAAAVLQPASDLLARLEAGGAKWERMHRVSEEKLNEMRAKAQRGTGKAMADQNTEYILHVPRRTDAAKWIDELNAREIVELAEPMALPVPPPVVQDYQPRQGYLFGGSLGVDVHYAWTLDGGAGGDVRIADIEYAWNLNHADLNATRVGPAPAAAAATAGNMNHGTAVLGVMGARNNGIGITGIAHGSAFFVVTSHPDAGFNMAGAITTAAAALRPGDIIVLEAQADGPAAGDQDLVPVEWQSEAAYNAVSNAVGAGIVVVEAAGNGSQNLDDPIFNTRHAPFRADRDSGAIIVGAGGATVDTGNRDRMDFSSFGSTVDLQGWGYGMLTTGYGDLHSADGNDNLYTDDFSGTSSATAMVAGACALVQSRYKRTHSGAVLSPMQVRETLRFTGRAQVDGAETIPGTFSQSGTTVSWLTGSYLFSQDDVNSIIRFPGGQQALITGLIHGWQVTVDTSQYVSATGIVLLRPANQNIGPRPDLRAAMDYVSTPQVWVDFSHGGPETGSFLQPFKSVPPAVTTASEYDSLMFKSGVSTWTGLITKRLTLQSFGGVTLGRTHLNP